jgi:hypothetical protein
MSSMDRRKFLGVVGAGSAAVSAAALSATALSAAAAAPAAPPAARGPGRLGFRAETALPGHPWPAYATAIAEGSVDLGSGTGFVATRVLAGQPGNSADIGLPGTARLIRITNAATIGSTVHLQGVVEDRSTLGRGESARKSFVLDQASKQLRAEIAGTHMSLTLTPSPG